MKDDEIEHLRVLLVEKEELLTKEATEKSELWQKLAESSQLVVKLREELGHTANHAEEIALCRKQMEEQTAALTGKIHRQKAKKATLKSQIEDEQRAKGKLQEALQSQTGGLLSKLIKRKAKKAALKAQLEADQLNASELNRHKELLESQFVGLKNQLEMHEVEKDTVVQQLAMLQKELGQYKSEVEAQSQRVAEKNQEIAAIGLKLTEKKAKLKGLKLKLTQVEAEKNEIQTTIEHLKHSGSNEQQTTIEKLISEKEECFQQLSLCQSELSEAHVHIQDMEETSSALNDQLSNLISFDKSRSDQMLALKQENAKIKSELSTFDLKTAEQVDNSEDCSLLKNELAAKTLQIVNLEAKLAELERMNLTPPRDRQACLKCSLF